jgi:signal transduction histidine kinase
MSTDNRRILLVDDSLDIHEDFKKILDAQDNDGAAQELGDAKAAFFGTAAPTDTKNDPFEIDSAYQGQEALEMILAAKEEGRPYAMAFIDVRMPPGWDGVETVTRLFQHDSDIQIVICTAYSDYSWDEMVERIGQSDRLLILKKPFDPVEICQLAHALTNKWNVAQQQHKLLADLQVAEQEARNWAVSLENSNTQLEAAKAAADRSSKMKTEFLVHLSKEFHGNLNSILGQASHLRDPGKPAPSQFDLLEVVLGTSHHLISSLDQMLDITMIEAGRVQHNIVNASPGAIVNSVFEACKMQAEDRGLTLTTDIAERVPQTLRTDSTRLTQALELLVQNAIRNTQTGSVQIRACFQQEQIYKAPMLYFEVEDTSPGIPIADFEDLFEPFFQHTGAAAGGTGLNLALAQRIAQLLYSDITVQSTMGQSTTMKLTIGDPTAPARETKAPSVDAEGA